MDQKSLCPPLVLARRQCQSTCRSTHLAADLVVTEVMNTSHQTRPALEATLGYKVPGSEHKQLLSKVLKNTCHETSVLSMESGGSLLDTSGGERQNPNHRYVEAAEEDEGAPGAL